MSTMKTAYLISDEFTNPTKRRAMMEKRMSKVAGIEAAVPPPVLWGRADADVTLIGWGSTKGVIEEACEILTEQGISANQLQIRWLVPLHGDAILDILQTCPPHHHRGEQLQRPVRALPAQRNQLRARRTHPQSMMGNRSCPITSWKR